MNTVEIVFSPTGGLRNQAAVIFLSISLRMKGILKYKREIYHERYL